MQKKILAIGLAAFIAVAGLSMSVLRADDDDDGGAPTAAQITFAEETSGTLINSLLAGLVDTFLATTAVPNNVAEGNQSISLIFDDRNRNIRLVGNLDPLSERNRPRDSFEVDALAAALGGGTFTAVEQVSDRFFFRSSVPLANFIAECALCHSNFGAPTGTDWTGALMVRVPIPTGDDDDDD